MNPRGHRHRRRRLASLERAVAASLERAVAASLERVVAEAVAAEVAAGPPHLMTTNGPRQNQFGVRHRGDHPQRIAGLLHQAQRTDGLHPRGVNLKWDGLPHLHQQQHHQPRLNLPRLNLPRLNLPRPNRKYKLSIV